VSGHIAAHGTEHNARYTQAWVELEGCILRLNVLIRQTITFNTFLNYIKVIMQAHADDAVKRRVNTIVKSHQLHPSS